MAGRSVVGSDLYGVFPLKGKLLNVREVPIPKVRANEQITSIAKILGLSFGAVYDRERVERELRYGHVMMMCDQDNDGSHIKVRACALSHVPPVCLTCATMTAGPAHQYAARSVAKPSEHRRLLAGICDAHNQGLAA